MSERGDAILHAQSSDQAWTALTGGNPTKEEMDEAVAYVAADASERQATQNARRVLRGR